jgi:hypothetical protein
MPNPVPKTHQQCYDLLEANTRQFFYIHNLWQGVSCIRLKSGVIKDFVSQGATPCQAMTFLWAAKEIVEAANTRNIWVSVRFSNNGYQSVLVYLGTRNIDEFMRLSQVSQRETTENN